MNISGLKSSTAAVLCLSLMQPLPGLAQVTIDGAVEATGADDLAQTAAELAQEAENAAEKVAAEVEAAEQAAADEAKNAADEAAAAEAQAAADQAAAAEAQAAADEAAAAAEAKAVADKTAADEAAAVEAQAAAAAEAQAAADNAAADDAAAVATQAEPAEPAGAATETDVQAATEQAAETQAETEPNTGENDDKPAEAAEVQAEAAAQSDPQADVASSAESEGAGEASAAQLTDTERQERAQQREAQSTSAAEATAEGEAAAEVETQTVTEDDVRSSDEDFATGVTGDAQAATTAAATPGKDKGLSNFEKALLLGLGAAVVGTILANGDRVVSNSGDRVVVERDGELRVLKNDDQILNRPGAEVSTQTFRDGSTRTTVAYNDGSQIVTVRASDGTVLRRTRIRASDGKEFVLFDDTQEAEPVDFDRLPSLETIAARQAEVAMNDEAALQKALQEVMFADVDRRFSLRQVRDYKRVRALAPQVELDAITFATGSAAIQPSQAQALADLGGSMRRIIEENPSAMFLIEGHTDAVGAAGYNLALSDRRAETVALALTEYFDVPPQNLITQGYGESDLKIRSLTAERANRRAAVRNITSLLN